MSSLDHGYWKSLAELERDCEPEGGPGVDGDPKEFPETASDAQVSDPLSRRNFVQIMGASMALAGVAGTGCKRYEKDEIVPLSRRPEDQIPGVPQHYATAWDFAGFGQALVATSYEGRPIKVDGNPEHPFADGGTVPGTSRHGGSTAFAQASILNLYDPDRSRTLMREGRGATFADFRVWLEAERAQLRSGSTRIRILSEASSSPTVARLREQLRTQTLPGLQWFEWESVSFDNERAGTRLAYTRPLRPFAHLDRAKTIVALDCDLFVEHPAALRYSRDWARGRRFGSSTLGEGQMNRLWSVESTFSSTGAVADHRLPLRSELILPFLMGLEARLGNGSPPPAEFLNEEKVKHWLEVLAEELGENRGSSVLVAGRRQPPEVHALVARINESLGAVGRTLDYLPDPDASRLDHGQAIARLVSELQQGQVDYLFILGGNPVFDAPSDLDFAGALAKVKRASVHLSEVEDETSQATTWHVPRAHYLEAWGDVRTYDGTVTIGQPLIQPMFGGVSVIELLQLLSGGEPDGVKELQATFAELGAPTTWRKAVHDGFVAKSQSPAEGSGLTVGPLAPFQLTPSQRGASRVAKGQLEVTFAPSTSTWDGRFANNSWLQETPDFLSKVTWDNFAMVSPATAKDLGLKNDYLIKVTIGDRSLEVPCYTMPGQAPYSIGVVIGGGRRAAGRTGGTGKRTVGFDAGKLRTSATWDIATGASVAGTGTYFRLANTQEHWDIRDGLKKDVSQKGVAARMDSLYREATLEQANKPDWTAEERAHFPTESLWKEKTYPEERVHAWGMAIDMGVCTGCNACAVACQSENNIPVVGKKNVIKNREMNWIRIDRYFSGNPENPEIVHQPLACVHCEMAPCEQVCPVGATLHSSEGLNEMTYNRCIGTRYCLNNCPYRVRRFNFFDYNKEFKEARNKVRRLLFNPEVTVRHRGVMEKCTYCVQRIQNAKITAKNQRVALEDGDIVTACQAACPTEAIVFGDLNDETSRVSRLHKDRRHYGMLQNELNTKPRTHFLARVRNPNPKLESPAHGGHYPHPAHAAGSEAEARAKFRSITHDIAWVAEMPKPPKAWYIALGFSLTLLGMLGVAIVHLVTTGIGIWGNNNAQGWAWDITNFVFWIGIGHAGTLISAVLYLFRQNWRTSIARSSEAMTIFAVMCAGIFPIIHTGRPWLAWWMIPHPNDMQMWPQYRSPLMWDVFAISTYATTSILFWFMGMVPDLATFRDRSKSKIKQLIYGMLALGWRGSARQWHRYERAYLILAALSTPLVVSVHSVVSFDFATSQLPGWHTTIFPPYFVAGAIFSGFAMVMTLLVPARYLFNLKHIITEAHIEAMCKITLATGTMVGGAYAIEFFIAWYSGNEFEQFTFINRALGPYWWAYFIMVSCNLIFPQLFWLRRCRTNPWIIVTICILVNIGMWFERFVIIATSLSRSFIPAGWNYFSPTIWDMMTLAGSFGLFFTMFLLFFRYLPVIAIAEVKAVSPEAHAGKDGH